MQQTIQDFDQNFIKQAIRDRAEMMINHICQPIDMFAELDDLSIPVIKVDPKPVAIAAPAKNPAAPYGYKKDGTPRARPGRPTKSRIAKRK
jgi:hypothetical protein